MFPFIMWWFFHLRVSTLTTNHDHILILCVTRYTKCSMDVIFPHVNLLLFGLSYPNCRRCEMVICLSVNQLSMQKEVNGITCCLKQTSFYLAQGTSYFWKADFILWMSLRWMHFTQFNNLIQPTLTAFIFVNRHHAGHFGRCRF